MIKKEFSVVTESSSSNENLFLLKLDTEKRAEHQTIYFGVKNSSTVDDDLAVN